MGEVPGRRRDDVSEKARFAASVVAQFLGIVTVSISYVVLYGFSGNRIVGLILIVFVLSLIITLIYAELIYDTIIGFLDIEMRRPTRIPVDAIIILFSGMDLIGLFFIARWTVNPDTYYPMFLTLLTIVIILRAPAGWVWGLTGGVGIAYGTSLFFPHRPIPVKGALESLHADAAHLVIVVFCLVVILVEHLLMRRDGA